MTRLIKFLYKHRIVFVYIPLAIHWISILILTSIPSESMPRFALSDKLKHFFAYFVLTIFLSLSLKFQERWEKLSSKFIQATIAIVIAYSTFDELHQLLIPGRDAEFWDWIANLLGLICGLLLSKWILNHKSNMKNQKMGTDLQKEM